ncbi:hypothetical protein C9374_013918 [Naegleria lovaniensis]|uniref:Sucrose transporter n=1 Tax=Naegleria lovaniensis TaxID=51637 RepID=A0AA88GZP3_NAELO|nr:uncharacterized protein C9374_013918 [Naegleria lovaniensis]KAG2389358.1 hypothetical protein C9374_013918 [Naegleria lovaniensis]
MNGTKKNQQQQSSSSATTTLLNETYYSIQQVEPINNNNNNNNTLTFHSSSAGRSTTMNPRRNLPFNNNHSTTTHSSSNLSHSYQNTKPSPITSTTPNRNIINPNQKTSYLSASYNPYRNEAFSPNSGSRFHQPPMGSLYTSSFEEEKHHTSDYFEDVEEEDDDDNNNNNTPIVVNDGNDNYYAIGTGDAGFYYDMDDNNVGMGPLEHYDEDEEAALLVDGSPQDYYNDHQQQIGEDHRPQIRRIPNANSTKKANKTETRSWFSKLLCCCFRQPSPKKDFQSMFKFEQLFWKDQQRKAARYKKDASTWRLFFVTMCFCALQCCWSLQIAQLTPLILEMNFPKMWITIVWLCGPISGILVQPIVGVWSDKCRSRLGRRRPFILTGAIFIVLALCFIANCLDIGYVLGDTAEYSPWSLTFTIIGFWVLDIANNTLQGPCRALVADIATQNKQDVANACFTFWVGLGNIIGYGSSMIDFSQFIPMYASPICHKNCVNLKVAFYIAAINVVICCTFTLLFAKEYTLESLENTLAPSYRKKEASRLKEEDMIFSKRLKKLCCHPNPIKRIIDYIYNIPRVMKILCVFQFFSWIGWFAFLVYITDWVGESVFRGNPDPQHPAYQLYETGVRFGSIGLAGFSVVSMFISPFIPRLSKNYGTKTLLFFSQVFLSLLLLMTFFIRNKYWAIVLISCFGLPFSITNTLPFTICSTAANDFSKGTFMGILNIFIVVPQLIMSLFNPLVVYVFNGYTVATLVGGSIASLFSSVLVCFIRIRKPKRNVKRKKRFNQF